MHYIGHNRGLAKRIQRLILLLLAVLSVAVVSSAKLLLEERAARDENEMRCAVECYERVVIGCSLEEAEARISVANGIYVIGAGSTQRVLADERVNDDGASTMMNYYPFGRYGVILDYDIHTNRVLRKCLTVIEAESSSDRTNRFVRTLPYRLRGFLRGL